MNAGIVPVRLYSNRCCHFRYDPVIDAEGIAHPINSGFRASDEVVAVVRTLVGSDEDQCHVQLGVHIESLPSFLERCLNLRRLT